MSNVHTMQSKEVIRQQANAWVLRFNGDTPPTAEDISALKIWVAQSSVHRAALEQAEAIWCEADLLAELAVPKARSRSRLSWLQTPWQLVMGGGFSGVVMPRGAALAFVAAFCLTVLLAVWYAGLPTTVGNGLYQTAIGEQQTLTLDDYSIVQLDTHSAVRISYSDQRRRITLLRGKAYFDVTKNPQRPFEVYAAEGRVRAVGTAFTVQLQQGGESRVAVIVNEGRVELARTEESIVRATDSPPVPLPAPKVSATFMALNQGQAATFNRQLQLLAELDEAELAKQDAWRRGLLIFTGEPLTDVIAEISRYTKTRIDIADPALGEILIGGRFRTGELEALLDVLETGFGVQVSYREDQSIELRARNKK